MPDDSFNPPSSPRLRLLRALLLVAVPALAIVLALQWYARSARWAETDNAYVKAHVIAISAEVTGRVAEVPVKDQQRVARGALLFRLDPVPFQLAVSRAEAQLSVTRTEIETLRSEYRGATSMPRRPPSACRFWCANSSASGS